MTGTEVGDVTWWVTTEGAICEQTCFERGCCTDEPDRLTLVLSNRSTGEEWGLYGGRDQVRALVSRLTALLDDDDEWNPADYVE